MCVCVCVCVQGCKCIAAKCNAPDNYGMRGLHHACQRGNHSTVEELMGWKEVQIDLSDRQDQTALHFAANRGDAVTVDLLLGKGEYYSVV